MRANKIDIAAADWNPIGTHYAPVEVEKQFPTVDSMRWNINGEAEAVDFKGNVLATWSGESDGDDMYFGTAEEMLAVRTRLQEDRECSINGRVQNLLLTIGYKNN